MNGGFKKPPLVEIINNNPHHIFRDNLGYITGAIFSWLNDLSSPIDQTTVCLETQVETHLRLLISCIRLMRTFVCHPEASLRARFDDLCIIVHTVSGLKYLSDEENTQLEDSVYEVCTVLGTQSSEMKEEFRAALTSAIRCLIEPTREQFVDTFANPSDEGNTRKRQRTDDAPQTPEKKTETNAQFIQRVLCSNIEKLERLLSQIMDNPNADLHSLIRSIFDCTELRAMWDFENEY
jgi:hypothetical protein